MSSTFAQKPKSMSTSCQRSEDTWPDVGDEEMPSDFWKRLRKEVSFEFAFALFAAVAAPSFQFAELLL